MKTLFDIMLDQLERVNREAQEYEDYLAQQKEKDMNDELAKLEAMSEDEACDFYKVDSKADASQLIKDYYQYLA